MHIKTYTQQHTVTGCEFYILNKGMNSGKPLLQPCPNCFVCVCTGKQEHDFYYWLLWAMWQAKTFEPVLCGSVISFLRLPDLKQEIARHETAATAAGFARAVEKANQLAACEKNLLQQLQLLRQMKVAVLRQQLQ